MPHNRSGQKIVEQLSAAPGIGPTPTNIGGFGSGFGRRGPSSPQFWPKLAGLGPNLGDIGQEACSEAHDATSRHRRQWMGMAPSLLKSAFATRVCPKSVPIGPNLFEPITVWVGFGDAQPISSLRTCAFQRASRRSPAQHGAQHSPHRNGTGTRPNGGWATAAYPCNEPPKRLCM